MSKYLENRKVSHTKPYMFWKLQPLTFLKMLEFRCDTFRFKSSNFACIFQAKNLNFHEKSQKKVKSWTLPFSNSCMMTLLEIHENHNCIRIVRNSILFLSTSLFPNIWPLGPVCGPIMLTSFEIFRNFKYQGTNKGKSLSLNFYTRLKYS